MINDGTEYNVNKLLLQTMLTIYQALNISRDDVYRIMDESLEYEASVRKAVGKIVQEVKTQIGIALHG